MFAWFSSLFLFLSEYNILLYSAQHSFHRIYALKVFSIIIITNSKQQIDNLRHCDLGVVVVQLVQCWTGTTDRSDSLVQQGFPSHLPTSTFSARHGNRAKCLGSAEPKWPGSRGRLGPSGVQGQCPAGGPGGQSPLAEIKFGYFGDQFAASQCTEIVKTIFFCFGLEVETSESTFHYFLCHTNQFF